MKIGFYCIPTTRLYSFVEPYYLSALKLNHQVHITTNASDCFKDDITFLFIFSRFNDYDLYRPIYGKSKCVVLVQTEQIQFRDDYLAGYTEAMKYADVSAVTMPEVKEFTLKHTAKPVIDLFYGYHPSKTIYQNMKEELHINWDVFQIELKLEHRIPYYDKLDKEKISYFKDTPLFDQDKIAYYSNHSKICLNIQYYGLNACLSTSRVIGNFMANKGFCLIEKTSYPFLKDGEHLVYFETQDEMIDKIHYYIQHQDEARKIANNGFEFIKNHLNLDDFTKAAIVDIIDSGFIKKSSIFSKVRSKLGI